VTLTGSITASIKANTTATQIVAPPIVERLPIAFTPSMAAPTEWRPQFSYAAEDPFE
jgi:hypothetical protein